MTTKTSGAAVFVLALLSLSGPASAGAPPDELVAGADWKLVTSADGISVYRRAVDGSSIDEIRAETDVPADLDAVAALLQDVSRRVQWDPTCKQARLLKRDGDLAYLAYYQIDLPWPVQDRDVVMTTHVNHEHQGVNITSVATPDEEVPQHADFVRILQAREHWQLSEADSGMTRVRLLTHVEPAGPIPSWLINAMSAEVPESMLRSIRQIAEAHDAGSSRVQIAEPAAR
jgi:ribosome-associated toxin RatA of RatAB toxin-antitoxin module